MNNKPILGLRQYSRIPFHADVLLHVDTEPIRVHLVDIALKGALVRTDTPVALALHEPCRLVLPLADSGEGVVMKGRIVHLDQNHIGIACENMDLTSLTRLRRLIELNTGDTELMDRELFHLFG
jgi:c-di-GMP-binding flagellar brake protein YcgR